MTRIIAGLAGSQRLDVPKAGTRPTSDRAREAIFSSLSAWNMLEDTRVLDLYAGSGALALEAISRGAGEAVLVERHGPAAQTAKKNVATVATALQKAGRRGDSAPRCTVETTGVQQYLDRAVGEWDVIFIDPPYDLDEAALAANLTALVPHLAPNAVVMVERSSRSPEPTWPQGLELIKEKNYGETVLWWADSGESGEQSPE